MARTKGANAWAAALDAARADAARRIRPGWRPMTVKQWVPNGHAPQCGHMRDEVKRRATAKGMTVHPGCWTWDKCRGWLETYGPDDADEGDSDDEDVPPPKRRTSPRRPPASSAPPRPPGKATSPLRRSPRRPEAPSAPQYTSSPPSSPAKKLTGKTNWWGEHCVPRLVNVIVVLKHIFLTRDAKLTRQQLDARAFDEFWKKAAEVYNAEGNPEVDENAYSGDPDALPELTRLNPGPRPGFTVTGVKLKAEFTKVRLALEKAIQKFSVSGNGDGVNDDPEKEGCVFSADFFFFSSSSTPTAVLRNTAY